MERDRSVRVRLNQLVRELFDGVSEFFDRRDVQGSPELIYGLCEHLSFIYDQSLPVASHVLYLYSPSKYPPLTVRMLESLEITSVEEYLDFARSLRAKNLKPMTALALLHMTIEITPAKVAYLDSVFGFDRKELYLKKAVRFWERGDYWSAHEVLEDLWCLEKSREQKDILQGIVRVAIALHHLTKGERDKALRVLRLAQKQISPRGRLGVDLRSLQEEVASLISDLSQGLEPSTLPRLRMV